MRRLSLLLAVLCVIPLFGSDLPKEYGDRTENTGIEGTWQLIEIGYDGQKDKSSSEWKITYRSGIHTEKKGKDETYRGNYRIDATRNPPHLDSIASSGEDITFKGIYHIDGETLRIGFCDCDLDVRRPQGFNDKDVITITYKRVTK